MSVVTKGLPVPPLHDPVPHARPIAPIVRGRIRQLRGLPHDAIAVVDEKEGILTWCDQPLDAATRAYLEPRFGRDLSRIRVHTDARAADSARSVQAKAYTVGQDLVFGQGKYAPATPAGRELLAHELTHAVQQRDGLGASPSDDRDSVHETTARTAGHEVARGQPAPRVLPK